MANTEDEFYSELDRFLQEIASRVFNPKDKPNIMFDKVLLIAHETYLDGVEQPGIRAAWLPSMSVFDILGVLSSADAHVKFLVTHAHGVH